jgi:hypothetical protein
LRNRNLRSRVGWRAGIGIPDQDGTGNRYAESCIFPRHFRVGVENKRFNSKRKGNEKAKKARKEEEPDLHTVLKPAAF